MDTQRRLSILILIMAAVVVVAVGTTDYILYRSAEAQQRERLVEAAQSEARLIEAVAQFDIEHTVDYAGGVEAAALSQIVAAHERYEELDHTGELTLARLEGDSIVFLLPERHYDLDNPLSVPFQSDLAEPMSAALSGQSGSMIGRDYRGEVVLAAYEPVGVLGLGIVAEIDLAEIREPFVRAALAGGGTALALVLLGSIFFIRVGRPVARRLEESEERFRSFAENAPDHLVQLDRAGTILFTSRAYEGVPAEAIVGSPAVDWLGEEYRDDFQRELARVFETGEPGALEFAALYPQKGIRWYSARLVAIRAGDHVSSALLSSRDTTGRKRAEQALRESENRYRALAENSPVGIFVSDGQRLIYVNPRLCDITGCSEAELLSMQDPVDSLFAPEERERVRGYARSRLEGTAAPSSYEVHGLRKDGVRMVLRLFVSLLELEGVKVVQGTVEDISVQKQAEEELAGYRQHLEQLVEERTRELQSVQDELVQKERLAVLGQVAGGVGHELRNPLAVIKNVAYYLKMVLREPEPKVRESLDLLEKEVDVSDRIIAGLLDLARQKPPARRSVDVNGIVRGALSRAEIPGNVDVVSLFDDTLPAIQADPDQLDRAFANIILNAVQAMPEGGRLSVRSETPAPGWVAVSFTDSGVGFSDEHLSRVFQPLFTTKVNGIGLGLAISRLVVEAHGGSIGVRSVVGAGTTFTVRLPAASEAERKDGDEGAHSGSGRQRRPARDAVPYPAGAGMPRHDGGRRRRNAR